MKSARIVIAVLVLSILGSAAFAQDYPPRSPEPFPPFFIAVPAQPGLLSDSDGFCPFIISFVPMISFPFGYYDVMFSGAAVGGMARDVHGFMGAGVFNLSRNVWGVQGAGVFNISGEIHGFQGAGVFNISDDVYGGQGAGVFNISGDVHGFQGAGVFNMADDVDGAQAAGVFNAADRVRGVQIGLVNIADEVDGFQLGLINIARFGVNGPGASFEPQTGYVWGWWQNGSRHLYTVISLGLPASDLFNSSDRLVGSLGIGSRFGRNDDLHIDLEAVAAQEIGPDLDAFGRLFWDCDASVIGVVSPYPELRIRAGLPMAGKLELVAGLTMDFDLEDWPMVPDNLKTGFSWSGSCFGEGFTAYTRWFLGFKL
jgi:hypothetical protein